MSSCLEKLKTELEAVNSGYKYVACCDEVGRGPLAGPVVCAAVIMPYDDIIEGVDDSKKLSEKKRERLAELIKEKALAYAICEVQADTIDGINILQATRLCMKMAVEELKIKPDLVLTDGNMTLDIDIAQRSVIGGDASVYSIGAASIIAKVYRDKLMTEYAKEYPHYGFEKNKGYGTKAHIQGIKEHGLCPIHRRTFTTKF